jgi:hypothetical protein
MHTLSACQKFEKHQIRYDIVCDLFYRVALNIARPLSKTKNGNRYALVAINHYSKWREARPVKDHDATTGVRFLEEEIICKFGLPRFLLTNNGGKWMAKFDSICKKYGISSVHSSTMASMQWDGWRE